MDKHYSFAQSGNVEINVRFFTLNLNVRNRAIFPHVARFLSKHGRGLYVKPLFSLLAGIDTEFAVAVFQQNRGYYHSVIASFCCKLLGLHVA